LPRRAARVTLVAVRAVCFLPLLVSACVDANPERVTLKAGITDAQLTVAQSSLVTALSGSFTLHLDLGDLAQQDATVSDPPTFQLVTAANRSTIVGLDAIAQDPAVFPLIIKPGGNGSVPYTLNDQASIAADAISRMCEEPVQIAGTLRDTSNGERPLAFESAAVTPNGCP
jgi:hypothetical protein